MSNKKLEIKPVIADSRLLKNEVDVAAVNVVVASVLVPLTVNSPVLVVDARVLSLDDNLLIVVVASVLVPVTVNRLVTVLVPETREVAVALVVSKLVLTRFVPVALSKNRLLKYAVRAVNTLLTERFPHTVLVPVVDELPTTMLPKSLTDNVDEPAKFLI